MRLVPLAGASLVTLIAAGCSSQPQAAAPVTSDLKAIVTVKELMESLIDPDADWIFDAVGSDITDKGIVETSPKTDEDWFKVQRGAVALAEASNLLKIPRRVAPEGDQAASTVTTERGAPELAPAEIQARIDKDRALWNSHADKLRDEALKVMEIVKARDASKLLDAGSKIDQACEACHLEYWYPGDKAAVLKDRNSRVFTEKPKP